MRSAPFAALLLLALPVEAEASCVSASSICLCQGAQSVIDGVVVATDGARTEVQVSALHGAQPDGGSLSPLFVPRLPEDEVGKRTVALMDGEQLRKRYVVDGNGNITCEYADPPFSIDAAQAISIALASNCHQQLESAGLKQPPCLDTGYGCSTAEGAASALLALAFLFATRPLRRRSV